MGFLVGDGHPQGSLSADPASEGCLLGEGGECAAPPAGAELGRAEGQEERVALNAACSLGKKDMGYLF